MQLIPASSKAIFTQPLRNGRSLTPYLLLIPGLAWLGVFFVIPFFSLLVTSLMKPAGSSVLDGYVNALEISNYMLALQTYWPVFAKSLLYAASATLLALVIGYPLAYHIALRGGRWRNLMLVLVIAPFFASYLIRTYAWKTILADESFITSALNFFNLLPQDRILNTPLAVIAGISYNFLPFMILPLYASIERIDPRLLEASKDLYADSNETFRKITLPLSMPGVVSGTLLTFIPAMGDFINASLLGSAKDKMIGNVIQSQFVIVRDYPRASALSFILMTLILLIVFFYIRRAGTEDLV
ncbi:MAG: ABC transporter permease [Actinomycetota bacterium]|nr:ABC transporter permease [Actinomycetota bacterium]